MYPISNDVKALFESEQKQILRITGGEKSPISKSVGPSTMASFSDAIAANALNLSVGIEPVQDLHGYDNPWPAGGGKNLLDGPINKVLSGNVTDGFCVINGGTSFIAHVEKNTTYTVKDHSASYGNRFRIVGFVSEPSSTVTIDSYQFIFNNGISPREYTFNSEDYEYIVFTCNSTVFDQTCKAQIEIGSTATSYTPYSNICPISGWTGAKVTRTGKNYGYFPPTDRSEISGVAFSVSNGELNISGTASANAYPNDASRVTQYASMPLGPYPAGTYTIKSTGFIGQNAKDRIVCSVRYADNTAIFDGQRISGSSGSIPDGSGRAVTFTATKPFKVGFWLYITSGTSIDCNVKLMMNLGTEPESYEPYQGETYDITFPSEAGTVYGGTLDMTTGLLTVTYGNIASYAGETLPGVWISSMDVYTAGGTPTTGAQVVYELATPQTYQLTPTQIALLEGVNNVWADCGDVTVEYATGYEYEINITDADVVIGSFNIDRFSCIGNKLEVGTATSAQMTVKLDNYDGRFNGIVFEGTELFVEIGIADWTQSNPTVNWIPCGYFTPDEQPRTRDIITIHALDRMMRFDVVPPVMSPWVTQGGDYVTDSQGNIIYFLTNVRFPITVENLVKRVATLCGVPFSQSLTSLPNYNYTIASMPTLQQRVTLRNLIQWCAGIMGANAWIDWTGSLRFSWYGASTGYTSTTANRFSSDLNEDDIIITGVQYTNTQGVTIVSGTDDYAIDLTGNYLAAAGIATILPNIKNARNGFTYRPFTASVINAPYLWPLDMITFEKDGINYTCALTNVNFGINGAMAVESKGETAQTNSGTAPSGVTTEQARLIEQAYEVANNLDKSLDQEGVFNRLTNNGTAQGIYIIDGQVYVNMSYARSGTLVLGGLNNQNGLLKVLDASGTEIGHWGYDGIVLNKGTIIGPSITIGGNGNTNGTLTVKDANNNTIGFWGNNQFSVDTSNLQVSTNGVVQTSGYTPNYGTGSITLQGGVITFQKQYSSATTQIKNISDGDGFWFVGSKYYFDVQSNDVNSLWMSKDIAVFEVPVRLELACEIWSDLTVFGTKNRRVSTDQYSDRLLYCYETPSPMFGDVGEGTIGEDGKCYIWLDPVFAQTITTTQYQVFLQRYGSGECWVSERNGSYFVVEGTPDMAFGWEIKAKQRDYDQRRLEKADSKYSPERHNYGIDAAQYINDLQKGRISA